MNERKVRIRVDDEVELDARLAEAAGDAVAVLCHPHPLLGGDMDNDVVLAARDAAARAGLATVRFDFRGVRRSTGAFAEGLGEAEDLEAVARSLGGRAVHAIGYSFGAEVVLRAVDRGLEPRSLVLIAPPVSLVDLGDLALPDAPCLVLAGDRDGYCALDDLEDWLADGTPPTVGVVEDADHFFGGKTGELGAAIEAFLRDPGDAPTPRKRGTPQGRR